MSQRDQLSQDQITALEQLALGPCETTTSSFLNSSRARAAAIHGARYILGASAVALAKRRLAKQSIKVWDRTVYEITPTGRKHLQHVYTARAALLDIDDEPVPA